MICLQGFATIFNIAGIISAFPVLVPDLEITVAQATYLVGVQVLFSGVSPLFWKVAADRYGRRPIWLISTFLSAVCNVGCALSKNYGQLLATRILAAIFLSPALALGAAVVGETFFVKQRRAKLARFGLVHVNTDES